MATSSIDPKEPTKTSDNQIDHAQTESAETSVQYMEGVDGPEFDSLHVDSQGSDTDSALGTPVASSTESMSSSLYEFVEENGRTYHKYSRGGRYYLPNDQSEQKRLDMQHELFKLALDGKLCLAPLLNPHYVLDVGTGTGIWAIDFATTYPDSQVLGTDLSPIQPDFVPQNCRFEIDDAEDEWVFTYKFDYIHGRALFAAFKDPTVFFKKAYAALAPGGYFEMQDVHLKAHSPDGTTDDTRWQLWCTLLVEAAKKLGRNWLGPPNYAQWMRDAGFENVVERIVQLPVNTWAKGRKNKVMGAMFLEDIIQGVGGVTTAVLTRNGMSLEEVDEQIAAVTNDIRNKAIHGYYPFIIAYGRKPLQG